MKDNARQMHALKAASDFHRKKTELTWAGFEPGNTGYPTFQTSALPTELAALGQLGVLNPKICIYMLMRDAEGRKKQARPYKKQSKETQHTQGSHF